jgi:EAL domain-containing protein (putative c-di-GMP-specific phosphodiesterase class I)
MSVNLSVKQFRNPNLVQELIGILQEFGMDPGYLQLEITESVVADDVEHAADLLQKLKGLGAKLAMDDFGTGYSSLVSLQRFPLDYLKIDRAFVDGLGEDEQDEAIVQLVIDLAHAMGMRAIAEGVETAEQLARLRDMGCDQAQGDYLSKPLAGEAATALLADHQLWLLGQYHLIEHSQNLGMFLEGRLYSDPE